MTDSNKPSLTPGVYRHYKGNEYQVLGLARHSESEEWMVVYKTLYGDYSLWVRPAAMFCENVTIDGREQPRFALVRALEGSGFTAEQAENPL
ncbi:DUF1653 domain-containing protein [Thalassolituus sp. LLYu03]|uniref:DUF1653 domain-containing protein n=1 Tax=Thalassolituus sp. LLYu03 TaxID=3421656 RepID=UPI003D2A76D3